MDKSLLSSSFPYVGLFRKLPPEWSFFFKNVLGFRPRRLQLYQVAFTHRSVSVSLSQGMRVNNERLEYLGDAVLGAIVADYLYHKFPHKEEGFLTILRSRMVSRDHLNKVAKKMGLPKLIRYDGRNHGIFKSKDGDGFEALVGAIYLDRGFNFTRSVVVNRIISVYMDVDALASTESNYKSRIIDWCQRNRKVISFDVDRVIYQGSDSRSQYDVSVKIDNVCCAHAMGYSIKSAEQLASEKSFKKIISGELSFDSSE